MKHHSPIQLFTGTHKSTWRTMLLIVWLSGFLLLSPVSFAKQDKAPASLDADLLTLAAMLIKDGNFQRALNTLSGFVKTEETLPEDQLRYHTLRGLAELNMQQYKVAQKDFYQAIKLGQTEQVIYIYLAQAHYALNEYRPTIQSIDKAGNLIKNYPALMEIKAQCYWLLEEKEQAWNTLNTARNLFVDDNRFLRRQVFYLVDLGFYRKAAELGKQYLKLSNAGAEDYIAIGNALRLSRQFDQATNILERARLQFQSNATVAKVLAHTYLDMDLPGTAASILEQASYFEKDLISEAAELYRRSGRYHRALALNARIKDQKVKLKQRVAILIGLKHYENVGQMESDLRRVGLLKEQPIMYALAYANFATGQFSRVEKHLNQLTDPELFKKGTELRRAIQECRAQPNQCV